MVVHDECSIHGSFYYYFYYLRAFEDVIPLPFRQQKMSKVPLFLLTHIPSFLNDLITSQCLAIF